MLNALLRCGLPILALGALSMFPACSAGGDDGGGLSGPDAGGSSTAWGGAPVGAGGALPGAGGAPVGAGGALPGAGGALPGAGGALPGAGGSASSGAGFVGVHGALRVQGNRIVDAAGAPVQLRGMSLFWSQWTDYYRAANVDVLVDDWKSTVVRVAVGVENNGGYLQDPASNRAKAVAVIDQAIARGIYVVVDWHDHHAQDHRVQANAFFLDMAQKYGSNPAVIFEPYNEPMGVGWSTVKAYAEEVIGVIRGTGANNLIIVGTPNWSQDVDVAAGDRITSDSNVAYTLHFYANTHRQFLRNKAQTALDAGLALFVTEWGTCDASGNGSIDAGETQLWLSFLGQHSISWANWSLHNKAEACSALVPSASTTGPWADDQLTASGRLVKPAIPPP